MPNDTALSCHAQTCCLMQAQSMSAGQRSFLFDYLCEHVPQTE